MASFAGALAVAHRLHTVLHERRIGQSAGYWRDCQAGAWV
jgi:hypothetical protein